MNVSVDILQCEGGGAFVYYISQSYKISSETQELMARVQPGQMLQSLMGSSKTRRYLGDKSLLRGLHKAISIDPQFLLYP